MNSLWKKCEIFGRTRIWKLLRMTPSTIRDKSDQLDRMTRRRNIDSFVVCFIVMACFSFMVIASPNVIQRVGALLTVLGGGYLAYQIRANQLRAIALASTAAKMGDFTSADFYRAALKRERDFVGGIPFWSRLVILVPGLPVLCFGEAIAHPDEAMVLRIAAVVYLVIWAAIVRISLRRAHTYQDEIDKLESLKRGS